MSPPQSTPVSSQNISPLLTAARAVSSKKKKRSATENENVSTEPPAAHRKKGGPTTTAQQGDEGKQPTEQSLEEITNQLAAVQAALENERATNMDLQKKLDNTADTSTAHKRKEHTIIPRPAGTAGKDWSIQVEMGLSKTLEGHKTYQALLRQIHDITLQSRINWEVSWSQVQPREKATLFDVARERNPIFKRYQNDWATEELVKQYVKNKRRWGYNKGWLEVPEQYAYLKKNASKRSNVPRRKRTQGAIDAAKKKAATAEKAALKRAAVARGKRTVVDDESDEQDKEGKDDEGEEEDIDTE